MPVRPWEMKDRATVPLLAAIGSAGIPDGEAPLLEGLPVPSMANCAHFDPKRVGPIDVVFVIDRSRSTIDATGKDINQNGKLGSPVIGRVGSMFDLGSTDNGDSFL